MDKTGEMLMKSPVMFQKVSYEKNLALLSIIAGQIITTSAEVTLTGGLLGESSQNTLNSGLGIILICPDYSGWLKTGSLYLAY